MLKCLLNGNRIHEPEKDQSSSLYSGRRNHPKISSICWTSIFLFFVPLAFCVENRDSHLHEPFKWSLIRWDDQVTIRNITVSGAPSFTAYLTEVITIWGGKDNPRDPLNPGKRYKAFYMCPAANPGKGYCNIPGYNYCRYWGCETIAQGFQPGGGPDKFLQVGRGPHDCKPPTYGYDGTVRGGHSGWCQFIYLNITQPQDASWFIGKTWGIQLWEPGTDRGGMILIKKERVPHDLGGLGPNQYVQPQSQPSNIRILSDSYTRDNHTQNNTWRERKDPPGYSPEDNTLWKVMQASYGLLNNTYPNLTQECWLCYSIKPPYYEAVRSEANPRRRNGTNPRECLWKTGRESTPGLTIAQVIGKGICLGKAPQGRNHLCSRNISLSLEKSAWLIPAANIKWVCTTLGITPCINTRAFNLSPEFCVQVIIVPRIIYHPKEYIYHQHTTPEHHLEKREPFTALTVAILLTIGGARLGTGATALAQNQQQFRELRISVDEDLSRIEKAIDGLVKSVRSLSEVVLQNRRGLDLLFLQQGGVCAALREECCMYADHTGIAVDTMAELRKQLEQRKREREAQQSWYETWFKQFPWLTTLLSTIMGPVVLLVLGLTFGPCVFNKIIAIVKSRLEAAHLMLIRAKYAPIQGQEEENLEWSRQELQRFSEQIKK